MPDDHPTPVAPDSYTAVLVQLGVLQEGQRNTLAGIEEIKATINAHGDDIGALKSEVAVLKSENSDLRKDVGELQGFSRPQKGQIWNIITGVAAGAAILLGILNQLYLN